MVATAHSSIGASSMYRWSACPGSVALSAGLRSPTSKYAAEGTVAHGVADRCLSSGRDAHTSIGEVITCEGHRIEVTEEMTDAVQVYVDAVRAVVASEPGAVLHVEERFDLSSVHPGCFGTSDACVWLPISRRLKTFDYKHGAGIAVDAIGNPQLHYYSLGALLKLGYPAREVEMTIVQPRCYHADGPVRSHIIPALELVDFMVDLKEYAQATEKPDAPLHAGDHCRFCPAAAICPEKRREADRAAAMVFAAPEPGAPYDVAKLAEALTLARSLESWVNNVHAFAYAEAERGMTIPGFKLVDKLARRQWVDTARAEIALKAAGLGETQLYAEPKIQSPAQIEKVLTGLKMKPAERQAVLEPLVEKKSSGHALVPDSDKREAVTRQSAADVFANA